MPELGYDVLDCMERGVDLDCIGGKGLVLDIARRLAVSGKLKWSGLADYRDLSDGVVDIFVTGLAVATGLGIFYAEWVAGIG